MLTVLKVLRLNTGQRQQEFARIHGFSRSRFTGVESGRSWIPPSWRGRLAEIFGVPVEELCDENGWPRVVTQTGEVKQ